MGTTVIEQKPKQDLKIIIIMVAQKLCRNLCSFLKYVLLCSYLPFLLNSYFVDFHCLLIFHDFSTVSSSCEFVMNSIQQYKISIPFCVNFCPCFKIIKCVLCAKFLCTSPFVDLLWIFMCYIHSLTFFCSFLCHFYKLFPQFFIFFSVCIIQLYFLYVDFHVIFPLLTICLFYLLFCGVSVHQCFLLWFISSIRSSFSTDGYNPTLPFNHMNYCLKLVLMTINSWKTVHLRLNFPVVEWMNFL